MNKVIEVGTKLRCLNSEGWIKLVEFDLVDATGPAFDEIVTVRRIGIEVEASRGTPARFPRTRDAGGLRLPKGRMTGPLHIYNLIVKL